MKLNFLAIILLAALPAYSNQLQDLDKQLSGHWVVDNAATISLNQADDLDSKALEHLKRTIETKFSFTFKDNGTVLREWNNETQSLAYRLVKDVKDRPLVLINESPDNVVLFDVVLQKNELHLTPIVMMSDGTEVKLVGTLVLKHASEAEQDAAANP